MKNSRKLHLGCGTQILDDYVNVDMVSNPGVDVICDLNAFPWPFPDDSFDEVAAFHFMEHTDDILAVLREIYRISRPGALWRFRVPYFASFLAFKDLTHKHFFTCGSFDNWDVKNFQGDRYVTHMNQPMRLRTRKIRLLMFSKIKGWKYYAVQIPFLLPLLLMNLAPRLYERFFFFFLPATNIYYELEVVKDAPAGTPM